MHQLRIPVASFLRLDARRLAAPSFSQAETPRVGPDGGGLASALAYLALNQPEAFQSVKGSLRSIFPFVNNVRFTRVPIAHGETALIKFNEEYVTTHGSRSYWGESIVFDLDGATGIPAQSASDGILLVLGLLTALLEAPDTQLLLLDDLDHGLHPQAQRDLVALLRKLLGSKPELQIVTTTHSPYLLDHLRPDEVRLTTRLPDGSVACARLEEHPDFERWKEAMTPGEFWSMVGEQWVGGRRPQEVGA
jgi:predicted ATPase